MLGREVFVCMAKPAKAPHSDDYIITMRWLPNRLGRLLGYQPKLRQYRGSYTVWTSYPSGRMCGTLCECTLYAIYKNKLWELENAC